MTNDNKDDLKADHSKHKAKQQPKYSMTGLLSLTACLIMLLLIVSCQPVSVTINEVTYEQQ